MTTADILKDAIAEAKLVKETAIASAKLQLQEAFNPQIQRIITARLEEEEGSEENTEETPEMGNEEVPAVPAEETPEMGNEEMPEVPAEETPEMGNEEVPAEDHDEYDLSEILRELDEEDEMSETPAEDEMYENHQEMGNEGNEDDEEIDIDSLMEELDNDGHQEPDEDNAAEMDALREENSRLQGELEEAMNAVNIMRTSLMEVNMLNAKLLFTNKLFKAHELNESQKSKVVDTFDRAKTIREVKLVYATLSESFASKKVTLKESIASKPVASTKPKNTPIILTEAQKVSERFKQLAGLTKKF